MSEENDEILKVLREMRDILREQADRVSSTLQAFVEVNEESNRKYQVASEASNKAYQEAQEAYKRKMERQIENIMFSPAWRGTVFVVSIAVIAICMAINAILRFTGN